MQKVRQAVLDHPRIVRIALYAIALVIVILAAKYGWLKPPEFDSLGGSY